MITRLEYEALKGIIKGNYTKAVLLLLKKRGIVQENGKPYSTDYIRDVFQGNRHHKAIESALWKLAKMRKKVENEE